MAHITRIQQEEKQRNIRVTEIKATFEELIELYGGEYEALEAIRPMKVSPYLKKAKKFILRGLRMLIYHKYIANAHSAGGYSC